MQSIHVKDIHCPVSSMFRHWTYFKKIYQSRSTSLLRRYVGLRHGMDCPLFIGLYPLLSGDESLLLITYDTEGLLNHPDSDIRDLAKKLPYFGKRV